MVALHQGGKRIQKSLRAIQRVHMQFSLVL